MTNLPPCDPEIFDAFKRGSLEEYEAHSMIYRHFMTEEERIQLAKDAVTLADISHGNVEGGMSKYKQLVSDINARLGFEYYDLICF